MLSLFFVTSYLSAAHVATGRKATRRTKKEEEEKLWRRMERTRKSREEGGR